MKLKRRTRLTRIQFERQFPDAETRLGPSWEVQGQPAKIAKIGDESYCAKTWGELAEKVRRSGVVAEAEAEEPRWVEDLMAKIEQIDIDDLMAKIGQIDIDDESFREAQAELAAKVGE